MAFAVTGHKDLLSLIDIKAPIAELEDGGYALTLGVEALNVGVKVGGDTAVEVFAEVGPVFAKVGVDQGINAYVAAGVQGILSIGLQAGLDGIIGMVNSPILGYTGGHMINGSGWATFHAGFGLGAHDLIDHLNDNPNEPGVDNERKDDGKIYLTSGSEKSLAAGEGLIQALASHFVPTSMEVPSVFSDLYSPTGAEIAAA
jgi:hypothetical protein